MFLLRVAVPLASLFFFSAFAFAQVNAPNCVSTSWFWAYNSLSQGPCTVLGYLMATCDSGSYNIPPLSNPGSWYYPPGSEAAADLCYCNTVGYSLFSACSACQNGIFFTCGHVVSFSTPMAHILVISWSDWVTNCTKVLPPSSFPNPVPSGIRVPHWALLDVTHCNHNAIQNENNWNPSESYAAGDTPEVLPGSLIGPSSVSTTATSLHPSSTGSSTPLPTGKSSNTGAIAGGAAAVPSESAMSAGVGASQSQQPLSDEVVPPSSCGSPVSMKFYDPNDPTTFPMYQGRPQSQDIPSQVPMSLSIGTGSTLGNTQTSLPQTMGYHGHPTV
ncbi:hypothetical protein BJV77DRAFT_962867 [Russula vinacea]|nr:hypothetical protein BJV77DRAFT_962867 [Russula vinacea]